jgi:hypothetical protein
MMAAGRSLSSWPFPRYRTVSLFLHICQGVGLALAAGMRPFFPVLLAGALARADVLDDFHGTSYAFLQSPGFRIGVAVAFVVAFVVRRREVSEIVATASLAVGGLLFAAVLAAHHDAAWPGLIAGVLLAAAAAGATRPILTRAAARLNDGAARAAVSVYADGVALLLAALAWFAPPVSLLLALACARLLWGERDRARSRFAGLRVLR